MRPVPSSRLLTVFCAAVQALDPSRLPPGRCCVSRRQPRGFPFGDFDLEDVMLPEVGAAGCCVLPMVDRAAVGRFDRHGAAWTRKRRCCRR